jgi:hypothetical protein
MDAESRRPLERPADAEVRRERRDDWSSSRGAVWSNVARAAAQCRQCERLGGADRNADAPVPEQSYRSGRPPGAARLDSGSDGRRFCKQPGGKSVGEVGQLGPTSVAIDYVAVNGPQNRNSFANAHASSMCGGVRARVAQRLSLRCPVRSVRSVVGARPPRAARGRGARREPCEAHGFQRTRRGPLRRVRSPWRTALLVVESCPRPNPTAISVHWSTSISRTSPAFHLG